MKNYHNKSKQTIVFFNFKVDSTSFKIISASFFEILFYKIIQNKLFQQFSPLFADKSFEFLDHFS